MEPKTNLITFEWKFILCSSLTVIFSTLAISLSLTSISLEVFESYPKYAYVSVSELKCNCDKLSTDLSCVVSSMSSSDAS